MAVTLTHFLSGSNNTRKCYGSLGCLEITEDWYGMTRPVNVLPQDRNEINTQFFLRTREKPEGVNTSGLRLGLVRLGDFSMERPANFKECQSYLIRPANFEGMLVKCSILYQHKFGLKYSDWPKTTVRETALNYTCDCMNFGQSRIGRSWFVWWPSLEVLTTTNRL